MQILGFNFEKIRAERKSSTGGKIEISSNIDVKEITQEKLDIVKDQAALRFAFDFSIKYKPEVAEVSLQGALLFVAEKDKAKDILKKWKTKKIDEEIKLPIFNFIMTKCNLKALQLEEELNLPTHIPFPRLQKEQNNQKPYTG